MVTPAFKTIFFQVPFNFKAPLLLQLVKIQIHRTNIFGASQQMVTVATHIKI